MLCFKCKQEFESTHGNQKYCKKCLKEVKKEKDTKLRERNRIFLFNFKKDKKCECCGWDKFPQVLEFHHKYEKEKINEISNLVKKQYGLKTIKNEMRKCILLCPNCHRELHYNGQASVRESIKRRTSELKQGQADTFG